MNDSHHNQRDQLANEAWEELALTGYESLKLSDIAQQCGMTEAEAVLVAGDVMQLILGKLQELDKAALAESLADFADDPDASIYDKILEGLTMRFEHFAQYRSQINALHQAAFRNPLLGLSLSHQLSETIAKLLFICGDTSTGWRKQARILGVTATVMRVRSDWADDETAGMELTMKKLDEALMKACDWALTLQILSDDDISGNK